MGGLANHFIVDTFRLTVWLFLLTAIFVPLERFFTLRPSKLLRGAWLTDLGYYFLSSLLPNLVLAPPLALIAWAVHGDLPASYVTWVGVLPLGAKMAAALVIGEIGFYWGHRWSHEVPLLWRFHAIHHSAEHLDYMVNTRAHPVDMVFGKLVGLAPLYAFGLANPVGRDAGLIPVLVVLIGTVWGFFLHANVRWRLGPVEHFVATPAFHHWHHSRIDHIDRNYASLFPWLDRLFGTLHLPRDRWPSEYGIEAPMPGDLTGQLLHPLTAPATISTRSAPPPRTGR